MSLQTRLPELSRWDLIRFDLTWGLPTALRVLKQRLSIAELLTTLGHYLVASVQDPFRGVDSRVWPRQKETLTRHQLRSAIALDTALERGTRRAPEERVALLHEVIAETGAAFITFILPLPAVERWDAATPEERQGYVESAMNRFFNADIDNVRTSDSGLRFDVRRCRFAEIAHAVDRPYLAPMFCAADSVFFGRPHSPATLERTSTLAKGGTHCDFHIKLKGAAGDGQEV